MASRVGQGIATLNPRAIPILEESGRGYKIYMKLAFLPHSPTAAWGEEGSFMSKPL